MTDKPMSREISQILPISMFEEWLKNPESSDSYSELTISSYLQSLREFEAFCQENEVRGVSEVDVGLVRHYAQNRMGGLRMSSKLQKLSALSSFFDYLVYEDIVDENPIKIYRERLKEIGRNKRRKRTLPPVLSESDVEHLIGHILERNHKNSQRNAALIGFLLDTGLRASEARLVTLDQGERILRGEAVIIKGKGGIERKVPSLHRFDDLLEKYIETIYDAGSVYLFHSSRNPLTPMSRMTLYSIVNQSLSRAGLSKPQNGPHLLRHTAASLMIKAGWEITKVRDALGHGNIMITERYLHVV